MEGLEHSRSIIIISIRKQIFSIIILLMFFFVCYKIIHFLRVPFGFLLVFFCPGYLLTLVLFPRREDINTSERIALSLVLSIVVTLFVALLLNYSPWRGKLYPKLYGMMGSTIIIGVLGWIRSCFLKKKEIFSIPLRFKLPRFAKLRILDKLLLSLLILSWLSASFAICQGIMNPRSLERFTEFYLLSGDRQQKGYPTQVQAGQRVSAPLGIVNREHLDVSYQIEVRENGLLTRKVGPIQLEHDQRWEELVSFVPISSGKEAKIEFFLYKDKLKEPYRSLHLWIDVL